MRTCFSTGRRTGRITGRGVAGRVVVAAWVGSLLMPMVALGGWARCVIAGMWPIDGVRGTSYLFSGRCGTEVLQKN